MPRVVFIICLVVSMLTASLAAAQTLGLQAPPKGPAQPPRDRSGDGREGGETIADAVEIPGLPFADTGNTCDNVDDYDESCPYPVAASPDVVYSYTPFAFTHALAIDLCGSSYDTKVYAYDAEMNLLGCNDDYYFGDPCGVFVSYLVLYDLPGGEPIYIVVDGYGNGACGDYELEVYQVFIDCFVECPPGGVLEGEPPIEEDYLDAWNGGCNSPEFGNPFQAIWGGPDGHVDFCGVSGWYTFDGSDYRDTDWFTVVIGDAGVVLAELYVELPAYLFELFPHDCAEVAVAQLVEAGACAPATMDVVGTPGDLVWLWVGPTQFTGPGWTDEFDYLLILDGVAGEVVATDSSSWSGVKELYR